MLIRDFLACLVLLVVSYFIVGLPAQNFLNIFFSVYLFTLIIDCIVHFVAHSQRSGPDLPLQLIGVFIFIVHYVSGFYITNLSAPVRWMKEISFSRYAFESVLVSLIKESEFGGVSGSEFLAENGFQTEEYYYWILTIFVSFFYFFWILCIIFRFHEKLSHLSYLLPKFSSQSTKITSLKYHKVNIE